MLIHNFLVFLTNLKRNIFDMSSKKSIYCPLVIKLGELKLGKTLKELRKLVTTKEELP